MTLIIYSVNICCTLKSGTGFYNKKPPHRRWRLKSAGLFPAYGWCWVCVKETRPQHALVGKPLKFRGFEVRKIEFQSDDHVFGRAHFLAQDGKAFTESRVLKDSVGCVVVFQSVFVLFRIFNYLFDFTKTLPGDGKVIKKDV